MFLPCTFRYCYVKRVCHTVQHSTNSNESYIQKHMHVSGIEWANGNSPISPLNARKHERVQRISTYASICATDKCRNINWISSSFINWMYSNGLGEIYEQVWNCYERTQREKKTIYFFMEMQWIFPSADLSIHIFCISFNIQNLINFLKCWMHIDLRMHR